MCSVEQVNILPTIYRTSTRILIYLKTGEIGDTTYGMAISSFSNPTIEQVAKILGDTNTGLTGTEIGRYLRELGIDDPLDGQTKWLRLAEALKLRQLKDGCANNICVFIERVMSPSIYVATAERFEERRSALNTVLSFEGLSLTESGKISQRKKASTISEAKEAADRLRKKLEDRGVHHEVLRFCREELVKDNYFHAVLEASKSVAQKIRDLGDLSGDGAPLVDAAFGIGKKAYPLLAFNTLQTETEQSEHTGLTNLFKGFFGTFRNPTAHAPKIYWKMSEQDALDMLTLASLLHRRLDSSTRTHY